MNRFFSTYRILLIAAAVIAASLVAVVQYTEVYRLRAVTLDGKPLDNWQNRFGLSPAKLVTDQPVDLVATELLGANDVVKIDIDYNLPGTISIRTNNYEIAAFLVDRTVGEVWGLDQSGRVVPLKDVTKDWEHPFFTGLVAGRAYGGCEDLRVPVVLAQLAKLASDQPSVYRLISEINFAQPACLSVMLEGINSPIRTTPEGLARQLSAVASFVRGYHPDLSDALGLDARFGSLVLKDCVPDTTKKDSTKDDYIVEARD